jgi:hypothetical protein
MASSFYRVLTILFLFYSPVAFAAEESPEVIQPAIAIASKTPAVTLAALIEAGINELCAAFAQIVTGAEGTWTSDNQYGCLGAFQFCPGTFLQYFKGTVQAFLSNPSAQVTAWQNYERDEWKAAITNGLTKLEGSTVTYASSKSKPPRTATIDDSAILMACQFGCGKYGLLYNYAAKKNCDAANVKDGNGVSVCDYLIDGANQIVSCYTGKSPPPSGTTPPPPGGTASNPPSNPSNGGGMFPTCSSEFGTQGPIEISTGQYTLRFGPQVSAATIQGYLGLLKQ